MLWVTHLQSNSLQPDVLILGAHLTALHDGVACCLHPPGHLLQTSSCYPTCTMDTHNASNTAQQLKYIKVGLWTCTVHLNPVLHLQCDFKDNIKAKGMCACTCTQCSCNSLRKILALTMTCRLASTVVTVTTDLEHVLDWSWWQTWAVV